MIIFFPFISKIWLFAPRVFSRIFWKIISAPWHTKGWTPSRNASPHPNSPNLRGEPSERSCSEEDLESSRKRGRPFYELLRQSMTSTTFLHTFHFFTKPEIELIVWIFRTLTNTDSCSSRLFQMYKWSIWSRVFDGARNVSRRSTVHDRIPARKWTSSNHKRVQAAQRVRCTSTIE